MVVVVVVVVVMVVVVVVAERIELRQTQPLSLYVCIHIHTPNSIHPTSHLYTRLTHRSL